MRPLLFLIAAALTLPTLAGPATAPAAGHFDPARHMRVSEVRPGMKGHGLSVFSGTKIEKFNVEVISVLKNFNPKYDVILVRCSGANLEHTGSISGMSGSPIYLTDDSGRSRMAGAFAYGWALQKDPVGGVQPIEYMLEIQEPATTQPAGSGSIEAASTNDASGRVRWTLRDTVLLPGMDTPPADYPFASLDSMRPNPRLGTGTDAQTMRLQPLATPLSISGVSPQLIDEFAPIFKAYGMVPLQGGGGTALPPEQEPKLEPGSALAVPLMTGDVDFTAIGTTTEVIGDKVWGFGHPFMNEGPISMPMGTGQIHTVIANLMTSFKLGSLVETRGALFADQTVGIAGKTGSVPPTAPIDLRVSYADGSQAADYHFDAALHPRYTPLVSTLALLSSVMGKSNLPQHHTLEIDLNVEFENGQDVRIANALVNAGAIHLFQEIGHPMMSAANNPFQRVLVKKITGTVKVTPEALDATVLSVNVPRLKYRPGELLKAWVTVRPFRAAEQVVPLEFKLPADLPEGDYQLVISDARRYFEDEMIARPFRFTAESTDEVFDVIREVTAIRNDALYVRLVRQPDGVAVGRTAMPHLPSSRRQILAAAGRSNITPFVSSTVKVVPSRFVIDGETEFTLTIDKDAKVEVGGPKAADAEQPAGQLEEQARAKNPEPAGVGN